MIFRKRLADTRISALNQSLFFYIIMFLLVTFFMTLPTIAFGGGHLILENLQNSKWYFIYCLILSVSICITVGVFREKTVKSPVRHLSQAAKTVAEGDFSVYLQPRHTSDKMDFIDTLYVDFNQMVAELGSIETLQNDFAANVSHELKTPLAAISNYLQLLEKTELSGQQKEYIDAALESCSRLSSLIFNILKLNKLENQNIQPMPERYDVCRQLAECAIGFETIWEEKEIEFEADMEDEAFIIADEDLMALVWNNLLSNAFKFTEKGGLVRIRQYTEDGEIVVEVSDTGCGMNEETARHVFDKFYQGDSSHSGEGNGLGLALAKRIVLVSDADIYVKSTPGEGSCFTVRIAADTPNAAQRHAAASQSRYTPYIGYEYEEITVKRKYLSLYEDSYSCFGWEHDPNREKEPQESRKKYTLYYRRNRRLRNRTELTRLQRQFDGLVEEINKLERSKTKNAHIISWTMGGFGLAFLAASTFAVTSEPPYILLCIILAIPAIVLIYLPHIIKDAVVKKRTLKITPLIEDKYDEIYEICKKGRRLMN